MSDTDRKLIIACRRGDERAWETLIARHERLVFSIARRHGLTAEDAADVTQTVFLKRQMLLFTEESLSVALWFGSQEILFSEVLTYEEAIEAIEAITTADIHRVAQMLFREEKLNLAVVGPFNGQEGFRELLAW